VHTKEEEDEMKEYILSFLPSQQCSTGGGGGGGK
jgi:hypothetical protein